jgi:mono/diheme cytochrome c family protein
MQRSSWKIILVLIAFALSLGAGATLSQQAEEPEGEPPEAEVPLVIPEKEKNRKNPYAGSAPSVDNGKQLFQTQCTMCHGTKGDGRGDLVDRLGLEVPDFTDPAVQQARTDGELYYILSVGHGEMQGEGDRLTEEWRWDLVNYIRSLRRAP